MINMSETTTIRLTTDTKKRLEKYGTLGDTFDSVLNVLMDYYDSKKEKQKVR